MALHDSFTSSGPCYANFGLGCWGLHAPCWKLFERLSRDFRVGYRGDLSGAVPFLAANATVMFLVTIAPSLSLWLPSILMGP